MLRTRTYPVKTPAIAHIMWPNRTFKVDTREREVYLTFDDGPTPGITDWVLDQLAAQQAKASFFLVGNNVRKHPHLARRIAREGHSVGNHTYNHSHGWKTSVKDYLGEVSRTDAVIHEITGQKPRFFRPPYGKCHPSAWKAISQGHEIVLWDVLPGDFDPKANAGRVLGRILNHTQPGSIIVLHDSLKCEAKVKAVLPLLLNYFHDYGLSPVALQ